MADVTEDLKMRAEMMMRHHRAYDDGDVKLDLRALREIEALRTTRTQSQMLLIRVVLGLNPVHDPVQAVRMLYEQGREAFEAMRGVPCEHASSWKPHD